LLKLVKTRRGCAMMETTDRYDVVLNGAIVGQLFHNIIGYVGTLPLPEGGNLSIGERSITEYKREVAKLNREFKAKGVLHEAH
jgi:hypothetical protein